MVTRRTTRNRASKAISTAADRILDDLLGKARRVITEALEPTREVVLTNTDGSIRVDRDGLPMRELIGGDVATARWLVDRLLPKGFSIAALPESSDLSTTQGVIDAAEAFTDRVCRGEMTVEQGTATMTLLTNYVSLRAYDEIAQLRGEIERAEARQRQGGPSMGGIGEMMPTWGRLAERPKANTKTDGNA